MNAKPAQLGLAHLIKRLNSVKNCTLTHEGVLSANLWSGSAVHVYDVDVPLKPRQIKKFLQDTTRLGIGALFVVDARLLPHDGERLEPPEWLAALHELSGERVYTYQMQGSQLVIGQAHFKLYGGNLREVWYGPQVIPAGLPFYRVWVKLPSIRGNWLVGNFGNELFWKQSDFRSQRHAERAQEEGQRIHGWSSERIYGAYADQTMPMLQETKLQLACQQLGLQTGTAITEETVKAAFRQRARECHPDVSRLPKEEAEHRFRVITEAYAYIRTTQGW